jgi:hypothetical protein
MIMAFTEFDPAMEEVINKSFEEGRCDRYTKIHMMIGKLCWLNREHKRIEMTVAHIPSHIFMSNQSQNDFRNTLDKLEDEIEMLGDDISKELFKLGKENKMK